MAASRLLNRVYQNTSTVGTGSLTLTTAKNNAFCTIADAGGVDGDQVTFVIEDGSDFEISQGVTGSTCTTLTRAKVLISKIGGTVGTTKLTLSGSATVRVIDAKEDLELIKSRATAMALIVW